MAELETPEVIAPATPGATKLNFNATKIAAPIKDAVKGDDGEFVADMTLGGDAPAPEKGKDGKEKVIDAPKINYSRFKDYAGKEVTSDDDLEEAFKSYKTKSEKLEVLAQSGTKLKEDKEYQSWKSWAGESPEKLVEASLAYEFMNGDGMTQEAAIAKAKERVAKNIAKDPDWIEDTARGIRKDLKQSMQGREQQFQTEIENASKDISFVNPSTDFEAKVKDTWAKTDDFLGMKLPKDEKERTKLVSEAYLPANKLNELLKDPSTYQEVCLYLKYKKQWKANIESRTNGKSKVLDKLPKEPSIGSGFQAKTSTAAPGAKGFSGKGFLGR